ncbi:peptidoglycan/LPS O-acetylase OafA/YrhL [Rhizobium sp. BK181]|uniref:acyltransferase family protein n=1 Tax=Rhizobium sp. BK181 TaxID=2587072 RepID=UPI0016086C84|nr:acyltransferase [Rhizobium sp. BK181]MBB3315014.1 peptidoglycan/LPS O-acetylase OafA/YrhL [Rhizobium sp. BK181]
MIIESKRIGCLDGLRGLAALWVLLGHSLQLTGWHLPILSSPDLGVDLFIMLSGFLMVFHYRLRETANRWEKPATWFGFWLKRFFRIAPLYYVMLCVALLLGPQLYQARMVIDTFLAHGPQLPERYLDDSLRNLLMHLSFLFGLHPAYAFRTALPDWSLGLEMQFYAVFPIAMLLLRKTRWLPGAALIALVGFVIAKAIQAAHIDFPMPSFLPLKMHVFLCGMLIANGLFVTPRQTVMNGLLAVILVMIPIGGDMTTTKIGVRLLLVVGFFALVHYHLLPGLMGKLGDRVSSLMGNRFCHWLGELSFGVYLIHLLLLQPIAAFVIRRFGAGISAPERFAIVVAALLPTAYVLAYLGFTRIEGPGQKLGRKVLERIRGRRLEPA